MNLLKKLFSKKIDQINTNEDFWRWFKSNEKLFFKVIKNHTNIEKDFLDVIAPKLDALREGYWYLTGMLNDNTAELVLSADGDVKNLVFVEELVASAPSLVGWKFTALKPELDIKDVGIKMNGLSFNKDNISFYSSINDSYPDLIELTIVHHDLTNENRKAIETGVYIFLDNFLGELNHVKIIDHLNFKSINEAEEELVPIVKLKSFLLWREKEFVEKYSGIRYDTESDQYSMLKTELKNGNSLIALMNTTLLNWENKASHPWFMRVDIKYNGNQGMPSPEMSDLMNEFQDKLEVNLKDSKGYLNVGRETGDDLREIFYACNEFRLSSKIVSSLINEYQESLDVSYSMFKDKYWKTLERFYSN